MWETTIEKVLYSDAKTKKTFKGAVAKDELPNNVSYPSSYIINTQPRKHPGEHWLAVYFDKNQNGYFFDSYGHCPKFYKLENFMKKNSKNIFFNSKKLQGFSFYCGFYAILFLFCKSRNINILKLFTNNTYLNDKKILYYINKFKKKINK